MSLASLAWSTATLASSYDLLAVVDLQPTHGWKPVSTWSTLRELKDLGGWKTEQTVIGTYLQPDQDARRSALERLTTTARGGKSE